MTRALVAAAWTLVFCSGGVWLIARGFSFVARVADSQDSATVNVETAADLSVGRPEFRAMQPESSHSAAAMLAPSPSIVSEPGGQPARRERTETGSAGEQAEYRAAGDRATEVRPFESGTGEPYVLTGEVVERGGIPVAGAHVEIYRHSPDGSVASPYPPRVDWATTVGVTGRFQTSPLVHTSYRLVVYDPVTRQTIERIVHRGTPFVQLVLGCRERVALEGRIVDPSGCGVAGAEVRILDGSSRPVLSDERGWFWIEEAAAVARYLVEVRSSEYRTLRCILQRAQVPWLLAIEHRTGDGVVEVSVSRNARPRRSVRVELVDLNRAEILVGTTDEHGLARFGCLVPGRYEAICESDRHGFELAEGGDLLVELSPVAQELRSLRGRISDDEGRPLPNLPIQVRSDGDWARVHTNATGPSGEFAIEELARGHWTLLVSGSPTHTVCGGPTPQADPVGLSIGVGPHRVDGVALDADGRPIAAALITMTWSRLGAGTQSSSCDSRAADANGRFHFENLPRGTFRVVVRDGLNRVISRETREIVGNDSWVFRAARETLTVQGADPSRE